MLRITNSLSLSKNRPRIIFWRYSKSSYNKAMRQNLYGVGLSMCKEIIQNSRSLWYDFLSCTKDFITFTDTCPSSEKTDNYLSQQTPSHRPDYLSYNPNHR